MNENTLSQVAESLPVVRTDAAPQRSSLWRRLVTVPLKWSVGALLTQSILGSILVFGWLQRWTQRAAFKAWWREAGRPGRSFATFAAEEPLFRDHRHAPQWILGPRPHPAAGTSAESGTPPRRRRLGSLVLNFQQGLAGVMNVLALTLPGAALMQLGWWGGWQNSFHKGYEQFHVGPAVSWLGIMLFVAAMAYVPLGLARQAVTGSAREFWRGHTVWTLVRHAWAGCAALALLAASLNVVAMGLKAWPTFLPQAKTSERIRELVRGGADPVLAAQDLTFPEGQPDWNQLTDDQARGVLGRHFLVSGFVVFGGLLMLRALAGRVYATAVVRAVQRGALAEEALTENEWRMLSGLNLLRVREPRRRAWLIRATTWAASRTGRLVCAGAMFLGWFGFLGAVYLSQFLAYHPVVGFLNQPLVQLPYFRYVPAHLEDPTQAMALTALVLMLVGLVARVRSSWRRRRAGRPSPA